MLLWTGDYGFRRFFTYKNRSMEKYVKAAERMADGLTGNLVRNSAYARMSREGLEVVNGGRWKGVQSSCRA